METKTAGYRSAEARRGGPVGWLVSQVEAVRAKGMQAVSLDTVPARSSQRSATMRVATRKRAAAWMEQAELFPQASATVGQSVSTFTEAPATSHELSHEDASALDIRTLYGAPAPPVEQIRRKVVAARAVPAVAQAGSRVERVNTIARFLKVTGAIEGARSADFQFETPRRGVFKSLRLWSGSPETPDCSSVRY